MPDPVPAFQIMLDIITGNLFNSTIFLKSRIIRSCFLCMFDDYFLACDLNVASNRMFQLHYFAQGDVS